MLAGKEGWDMRVTFHRFTGRRSAAAGEAARSPGGRLDALAGAASPR
jgi:hypothetical protein